MKNLNDISLNLDDPAVIEKLKGVDVTKQPEQETEVVSKIKELQKQATFTMKLTAPEVARLMRNADSLGLTWKEYLAQTIRDELLSKGIGAATITSPSFGRKKVVGPSKWLQDNE